MVNLKDIKVGDTVIWDRVTDAHRGSYYEKRGVVTQKRGLNLEVDCGGVTDWWYWPDIRHNNLRLEARD